MADYEVQMALMPTNNVPADASVNTWSFAAVDADDLPDIQIALVAFYNALAGYWPSSVRQTNHTIKAYDRADPPPRAPVYESTWNLTAEPVTDGLPPEVALCLSFQAVQQSGVPQARRRGRVYIGPLGASTNIGQGVPHPTFILDLATAGEALKAASDLALNWTWQVWSTVNGSGAGVHEGWVDNAWDTQRRRGRPYTTRTIWP